VRVFAADLTDFSGVRALVSKLHPTGIIHCAAATSVDWCEDNSVETDRINVQASVHLSGLAAELNAKFIHISSDSVFDGSRGQYSETDEPYPLNVYAESKLRAEREVMHVNPRAVVARVNIYGWNMQQKQSLAEWILTQLSSGKQVHGFTDVIFSPLLVNDLAEALLQMLDVELTGIYHVAGSEATSKFEFARTLARIFCADDGLVVPVRVSDANLRARRPCNTSLTTQKVQLALGMRMPGVEAGLHRYKSLQDGGYVQRLKDCASEALACQS
jgi:dTDP-4-dehydrorhamnose reductase